MTNRGGIVVLALAVVALVGYLAAVRTHAVTAPAGEAEAKLDFNFDVRPILARNCFKCHGHDEEARQSGLRLDVKEGATAEADSGKFAIVPGQSAQSEMIARLTSTHPRRRMPPKKTGKRVTDAEIDVLRRWIDEGAEYAPHWAFVKPVRPPLPAVENTKWSRNAVDRFILARHEKEGLAPSAEADRRTLVRRLSLDLTGLPPTPAEVAAFLEDESPDAYGKLVDRLLASRHYGERWARVWLDLARYADSKGYEADRSRAIWGYRDWVIDAFNEDMPFDRFTVEQLAGDLLDEPTKNQLIATAFHRNTMTNDEGGTDDEEFRVAAVVDRVNTTLQVWMGMTIGCAQCHVHKNDPISHKEYYGIFAFLNQTADTDKMDDKPVLRVHAREQRKELAELERRLADVDRRIGERLDGIDYREPAALPPPVAGEVRDFVWVEDDLPHGALPQGNDGAASWKWHEKGPVRSGARATSRTAPGLSQHFFTDAQAVLEIHAGDVLFAHVYTDPKNPPRTIMLQFHDGHRSWEHRAFWGEDKVPWGKTGTTSRRRMGELPPAGRWVRLDVKVEEVGLMPGAVVTGIAFTQHGGTVTWDTAGRRSATPPDGRYAKSQRLWEERERKLAQPRMPVEIFKLIQLDRVTRGKDGRKRLRDYYKRFIHAESRALLAPLNRERDEVAERRKKVAGAASSVPVMKEVPYSDRRKTHVLERGFFLNKGEEVEPHVPAIFPPLEAGAPRTRLGLARWLVSENNPLTARVHVNRLWEQLFGIGLVETSEDFGTQGLAPSHPQLLDWLATEFVRLGWSGKKLLRLLVTSATYRQSSRATPERLRKDPRNRLLARGPRFRLEAEMVRDQALALSGLLSRKMYGPPVYPPQPAGTWMVVYNEQKWATSKAEDRYRRALYTFWRRTSPYPSLIMFDAPSREFCMPRRIRTNTPLQALVTLNDPVFVEASQALARRLLEHDGTVAERAAFGFSLCTARSPVPAETAALVALFEGELAHYEKNPDQGKALAGTPELAAWTVVANVLLNLDEVLTKG